MFGSALSCGRRLLLGGQAIKQRVYPNGEVDIAMARDICPYPVRVYEDGANARWQVFWPGVGSRSRAWHLHGHTEACRQVLAWAWQERLAADGAPMEACPIKGLFESPGPLASSSAD